MTMMRMPAKMQDAIIILILGEVGVKIKDAGIIGTSLPVLKQSLGQINIVGGRQERDGVGVNRHLVGIFNPLTRQAVRIILKD
jgi:hypothetical protein